MKLVIDANALFSFFKKESSTREVILDPELKFNLNLFAPKLALKEVGKHKDDICSIYGIASEDFDVMFSSLSLFIKIVKKAFFEEFMPKAEKILLGHTKDVPYVALSLAFKSKGSEIALWSNEERLKILEKYGIKVFRTSDLLKELGL